MTDIIDRHVIVLAPEKRYGVEDLALPVCTENLNASVLVMKSAKDTA
jgi:hypothetical protein